MFVGKSVTILGLGVPVIYRPGKKILKTSLATLARFPNNFLAGAVNDWNTSSSNGNYYLCLKITVHMVL